jgi:hypothetical protein
MAVVHLLAWEVGDEKMQLFDQRRRRRSRRGVLADFANLLGSRASRSLRWIEILKRLLVQVGEFAEIDRIDPAFAKLALRDE